MTDRLVTNGWLAQAANAEDVSINYCLRKAAAITPDTYDRRKQIARHKSQASHHANCASAFRELLRVRQGGRLAGDPAAGAK
jgi:hypothetical protein